MYIVLNKYRRELKMLKKRFISFVAVNNHLKCSSIARPKHVGGKTIREK